MITVFTHKTTSDHKSNDNRRKREGNEEPVLKENWKSLLKWRTKLHLQSWRKLWKP